MMGYETVFYGTEINKMMEIIEATIIHSNPSQRT